MTRRAGLLAEVLVSLALVMAAATGVLAVVLVAHHEAAQRELLAAALAAEARAPGPLLRQVVPGTRWWIFGPAGEVRAREPGGGPPDREARALADEARRGGGSLLRTGGPDEPLRFAVPLGAGGTVAVARLPVEASARIESAPRRVALGVLLADAAIFTAFGASLMRRRLVLPLRRLRDAAEATAAGASGARVPEEGAREAAELATAFNVMVEALERRTGALEKAVADLRGANQELRQARAGLERAERLAAVGRLAAGVAHEVGNPMGAILAFLELARRDPGLSDLGRSHLERAGREGERVREILRRLLDFSRPARGAPAALELVAAAEEVVSLVRAQRRYAGVEIHVDGASDAPPALADPHVVTQILLNLILNAADAVRGSSAPRVRVRIRGAALARRREDTEPAPARRSWDAVECAVEDDGPGVPEEDRERIFDPFFTTKPPGEGTGLGLANAVRLAEESGGSLELAPAGRAGACFVLRLPAAASPAAAAAPAVRGVRST